jgi:hypothetical protein
MVKVALAIAGLTTVASVVAALVLSARSSTDALVALGAATSTALAWGGGILAAVPASFQAFQSDRKNGLRALLLARGTTTKEYARGRVGGLALVLFAIAGGGTLVSGGAAFLLASHLGGAARALEGLGASLVYAAAFAVVVAPMSLAALGTRSRGGGYVLLGLLLVLPEMAEPWTSALVPAGWGELLSLPSALAALRASLPPEGFDPVRLTRSAFVLAAFGALCFAFLRAEIASLDNAAGPGDDAEARA